MVQIFTSFNTLQIITSVNLLYFSMRGYEVSHTYCQVSFDTQNPLFNVTNYNNKLHFLTSTEVAQNCQIVPLVEPRQDRLYTERQVPTKIKF